jgi:hypothetical protein
MGKFSTEQSRSIVLKTAIGLNYFDYEEIILFRVKGHKVECLTIKDDSPVQIYHSLAELEKKYCNRFFCRCNRATIVNPKYINNLETKAKKLHLNNDTVLKVSDDFIKYFRSLSEYKNEKIPKKRMHLNRKNIISRKFKVIRNKLRFNHLKELFKKGFMFKKTLIIIFLILSSLFIISRCESPERFFRPNVPEKLCSIGIIDIDDTTLRHISFERSFQSELPDEVNDSLRNFSFSISSSREELYSYRSDSTIKYLKDFKIPYNIPFILGEKYYLNAREKDLQEISAEVVATLPPAKPELISVYVEDTKLSEPAGCINILDVRTAKIRLKFISDKNLYYAIMVRCWGSSLANLFAPRPGYMDFSVIESNAPGFVTAIKGLTIPHWTCDSIPRPGKKDPAFAYFIEGNRISGSECQLTLTIQYKDGYCLYDFIKSFGIKVISIPKELYLFEKSVYTYRKTVGDPFAEPVYINGNIKGGNGIFALCRSKEIIITFSTWI